jgi:hypothetical protein
MLGDQAAERNADRVRMGKIVAAEYAGELPRQVADVVRRARHRRCPVA